jgi:hypothetical protein
MNSEITVLFFLQSCCSLPVLCAQSPIELPPRICIQFSFEHIRRAQLGLKQQIPSPKEPTKSLHVLPFLHLIPAAPRPFRQSLQFLNRAKDKKSDPQDSRRRRRHALTGLRSGSAPTWVGVGVRTISTPCPRPGAPCCAASASSRKENRVAQEGKRMSGRGVGDDTEGRPRRSYAPVVLVLPLSLNTYLKKYSLSLTVPTLLFSTLFFNLSYFSYSISTIIIILLYFL